MYQENATRLPSGATLLLSLYAAASASIFDGWRSRRTVFVVRSTSTGSPTPAGELQSTAPMNRPSRDGAPVGITCHGSFRRTSPPEEGGAQKTAA